MKLRHCANTRPACTVDWNDCFKAELKLIANPDRARVHGPCCPDPRVEIIGERRAKLRLDDRDQVVDEIRQPESTTLDLRYGMLY